MLTFKYVARNPKTGEKISAEVQAENEQAAAKLLRQEGLAPLEIKSLEDGGSVFARIKNRIATKDKILFSRQLSTLINAGLPLVQSLRSVGNQTQNKGLKIVINKIISDVEGGASFSEALGRHPKVFDQVYVSLISAGESSGTLDKSLERIALQQEKDAEILSKVRGAMVYPLVVILVMLLVVGFMIVKVLPQVEVLYSGLPGAQLPLVTKVLLVISRFTIKYWWAVIAAMVALGVFTSRWASTIAGKRVVDLLKMRMWPISGLFMKLYMARFARTGTTLVASGVPLIQMLEITGRSINNVHIENSLREATEKVKGGKALSEAISNSPNFLPLLPDMLRIGEQSGTIEQMLEKTADYYEKEVDNTIKTVSTIIEPVLMIILGVFAFIIVAAVLLPVYGLAGKSFVR
jgi:type IV pilus assembly protein PilC